MRLQAQFEFKVDNSLIRSNLRNARVMSEVDSIDQLHLSDRTSTEQRIEFQKKNVQPNSATEIF